MLKKTPIKVDISLILIAIIGIGLSLTTFFYVKKWEFDIALENKKKQANEHARILRQTFTTIDQLLKSIRGLYHVHQINRTDFAQFVKSDLLEQPGLQALQWVIVVPPIKRQTVEAQVRAEEGLNHFRIWEFSQPDHKQEVGIKNVYYPILFVEPIHNNKDNLGYDIGENKVLRRALEKALELGQLTTSGATWIQTATGKNRGFQVFLPVYRTEKIPSTVAERREAIVGFAVGVFLINDLIESVLRLPKLRTDVFLRIFDVTDVTKEENDSRQLLYAPIWYNDSINIQSEELFPPASLEFGGRLWGISFSKVSNQWLVQAWYAWFVLMIGFVFTIGLLRYVYIILTRALWAEELVTKRTQSLEEANQALNQEIETRERMTIDLEASRQRFQAIFNEAAIGIALVDLDNKILDCNRALQSLLRYHETELKDKLLRQLTHPSDIQTDQLMLDRMLAGKYDTYRVGKRYICKNGAIVWTNQSSSIVRDTNHPFIISMIEDITERKRAEEARLEAEKKYRDIFEHAIEGIFQCTPNGRYLSVNPAFVRMFGYESAEQVYTEITDIGQQLYVDPQRRIEFLNLVEKQSNIPDFEYQARHRDGKKIIWVNETVHVVRDKQGKIQYYEGTIEDVTQRKSIEKKLLHDATHDQLTGLFNRAAFTTRLTETLAKLKHDKFQDNNELFIINSQSQFSKEKPLPFAVLFVDLDRFKIVNDSMGHLVGDQLLTEIAHRLQAKITQNDMVARFGGDEFALLFENILDIDNLESRVDTLQQQLSQPYTISNEIFNTTASIGIALSKSDYLTADEILRDADTAMYEAKKQGRGKSIIFQPGMRTRVVSILKLERDLHKALERGEFCVHYQPIISLADRRTVGLEALVRWIHPERGLVSPDQFIPLAEETGLIKELGLWVFETACTQLRRWQTQFAHHANLGMNINVSPIQLKQAHLAYKIQDIIEKSGIKGPTCRVEITESAMMQDPESAMAIFNELKNLEVLLYVDDFGTGYSSLNYLQKFPIDALKIDKSFIQDIDNSSQSAQIAHAIIALGEAFRLRIVAEGVENKFQLSLLKAANCHHVQGYYFSKPKDALAIEEFLSIKTHDLVRVSL